jgi:hypothetical protein
VRRRQGAAGRGRRIAPRSGDGDADEDGGARTCMLLESEVTGSCHRLRQFFQT